MVEGGFNCWNQGTCASPSKATAQELEGEEGTIFSVKVTE